ncbi:MAG: HAD family hydrolase [Candidatus Moraniibacteriota bacterium]
MNILKLLAFDMDGTLGEQGGSFMQRTVSCLRCLQSAGLIIGPATGKNDGYCGGVACGAGLEPWEFMITETGAQFLERISICPPAYRQKKLPGVDKDLNRFQELIRYRQFGRTFQFYDREENFRPELKEGIITMFPAGSELDVTIPWIPYFEGIIKHFRLSLKIQRHSDGCIDIVPSMVSKALGIKNVCDVYGIEPANIITAVDGVNDMELTQGGVVPIAVGNAIPAIKAAVKAAGGYVAQANYGDGFIEGMKFYAQNGRFEPKINNIILSF